MFSGIATKFNGEKIYKYYSYKEAVDIYTEYFSSKKSKEKSMVISTYKKAGFNLIKDFFVYCGYLKLEDCIYEEIISTKKKLFFLNIIKKTPTINNWHF